VEHGGGAGRGGGAASNIHSPVSGRGVSMISYPSLAHRYWRRAAHSGAAAAAV